MEDIDIFAKVYVKFYICQILSSVSYPMWRQKQNEYIKLIEQVNSKPQSEEQEQQQQTQIQDYINDSNNKYIKRLFVYKEKIFSKVEILGMIVMVENHSYSQNETARKILYIDDTTGVIQCVLWKNKIDSFNTNNNLSEHILTGCFIRILGQVDYFANRFEINVERYQLISTFKPEMLFHMTLQRNIKDIEAFTINKCVSKEKALLSNQTDTQRYNTLKEFANRLLAFFQTVDVKVAVSEMGYTRISVKHFFEESAIRGIVDDFFPEQNKEQQLKCLQDVMSLFFEQNMFGKIIYKEDSKLSSFENAEIEIKTDTKKIKNEIYEYVLKKEQDEPTKGAILQDIWTYINTLYRNFFTIDSIKFILAQMENNDNKIYANSNCYFTLQS